MRKSGSREELVATLREMSVGWHHFGKDHLSEASANGADELVSGASTVTVGHTTYMVEEGADLES